MKTKVIIKTQIVKPCGELLEYNKEIKLFNSKKQVEIYINKIRSEKKQIFKTSKYSIEFFEKPNKKTFRTQIYIL